LKKGERRLLSAHRKKGSMGIPSQPGVNLEDVDIDVDLGVPAVQLVHAAEYDIVANEIDERWFSLDYHDRSSVGDRISRFYLAEPNGTMDTLTLFLAMERARCRSVHPYFGLCFGVTPIHRNRQKQHRILALWSYRSVFGCCIPRMSGHRAWFFNACSKLEVPFKCLNFGPQSVRFFVRLRMVYAFNHLSAA